MGGAAMLAGPVGHCRAESPMSAIPVRLQLSVGGWPRGPVGEVGPCRGKSPARVGCAAEASDARAAGRRLQKSMDGVVARRRAMAEDDGRVQTGT